MAPCSPPKSPLLQVWDVPAEGVGRILTEKPPLGPRGAGVSRGDTEPSLREWDGAEPGPLRPWSASPRGRWHWPAWPAPCFSPASPMQRVPGARPDAGRGRLGSQAPSLKVLRLW